MFEDGKLEFRYPEEVSHAYFNRIWSLNMELYTKRITPMQYASKAFDIMQALTNYLAEFYEKGDE